MRKLLLCLLLAALVHLLLPVFAPVGDNPANVVGLFLYCGTMAAVGGGCAAFALGWGLRGAADDGRRIP